MDGLFQYSFIHNSRDTYFDCDRSNVVAILNHIQFFSRNQPEHNSYGKVSYLKKQPAPERLQTNTRQAFGE